MATFDATEFARSVKGAWADYLTNHRGSKRNKRDKVYASSYSECTRRMVLDMTRGDELPPFEPDTLAKFQLGNDREDALLTDLRKVARTMSPPFSVVSQQEHFDLKDRRGRVIISGKVDGRIDFGRASGYTFKPPIEVKSWAPWLTDRVEVFRDLFDNQWTRKGAYQLLAYLLGQGEPFGYILLDKRGLPDLIPVSLSAHFDEMEDFMRRAEEAQDHREAGTLPDFHHDLSVCNSCDHRSLTCHPPTKYEAATIMTDPEVVQAAEDRAKNAEAYKAYNRADKLLKSRLKGIDTAIVGDFLVEGKEVERKGFTVEPSKYWKLKYISLTEG